MNDTWFKIKVWTKLSLIGLAVLFAAIFSYENYSRSVVVWFGSEHTMTVLELLVATFLLGAVATLLARPVYRTIRQIKQLKSMMAAKPMDTTPVPEKTAQVKPVEPPSELSPSSSPIPPSTTQAGQP